MTVYNPSSVGGGTPGGSNTQVQFNDSGAFGGDSDFVFDKTTGYVGIGTSSPDRFLTVYGESSTSSAGSGNKPAVNITGGYNPRMIFTGDGNEFVTSIAGIQFLGNYFFGIGANLDNPAIKIQANGAVFIDNLQLGYLGLLPNGNLDSFGRTEGSKGAITFGTDYQDMFLFSEPYASHTHIFTNTFRILSNYDIPTLVVEGKSSQTANLFEVNSSGGSGGNLLNVNATGLITNRLTTKQQQWEYDASNYSNVTVSSTGGVTFDAVGSNASFTFADKIIAQSTVQLQGYTVATLPVGVQGMTAFVTDALAPTFLGVLVGGGTVVTTAFFDGTSWVAK